MRQAPYFLSIFISGFVSLCLFLTGCNSGSSNEQNADNGECQTNCGDDDPNALYGGFFHWANYQPDLSDAVGLLLLDKKIMKLTTTGTLESMFTEGSGDDQEQTIDIFRSADNKIYFSQNAGCYEDTGYCQCAVVAVDPSTDAVSCVFQPDIEYKRSISSTLRVLDDGTVLVSLARGDNTGEEIWKIKDGVNTKLYSNSLGILDVFMMDNGGIFIVEATDNMGHGQTVYLPAAGGDTIPVSDSTIDNVVTKLNGEDDTYYYVADVHGYTRFDPATETLEAQTYIGPTYYTADGYMNINYDELDATYTGYELDDNQFLTPIEIPAEDITPHYAQIVLTSDEGLALGSPNSPMFTIEVDDETKATERWMLTNWGIHSWDLPNVPTAVDVGIENTLYMRQAVPVNGQSVLLTGGSYNTPYYLKWYFPDAGSGPLTYDLLEGVLEGDIEVSNITYDQTQHDLVFNATKTFDKGLDTERTEYYVGYNNFMVTDESTHSGTFSTTHLIQIEGTVQWNDFVFLH